MTSSVQRALFCNSSEVLSLTRQTPSALPPSSGDPLRDWRTQSLLTTGQDAALFIKAATIWPRKPARTQEVSQAARTDNLRADAGLCKQRRDL